MIDGRYEPVEILGTGGMAAVWKARDTVLDRWVAVKRLLPHLATDPEISERFRREAQASARLNHRGIVTVYDTGVDEEGAFIVLEYVEGETLAQLLARIGPLDLATTVGIVNQVAAALDYAHDNGVVHRDVKPANLILATDGTVQLADFGIARSLDHPVTLTRPGDVVGTLAYLAPEVIEGNTINAASDIYSLGAVAYEMLAGRPPFEADNVGTLIDAIRSGDIPPVRTVPDEIVTRIAAAMSVDPEQRPDSPGAFATSMLASTTLVLQPDSGPGEPFATAAASGAENPTLVMSGGSNGTRSKRWGRTPLTAALFVLAALLAIGYAILSNQAGGVVSAETSTPAAVPTSTTTTTTTTPTTTTTVVTTAAATPETMADEIRAHLEALEPPTFKPKEVKEISDRLDKLMEAWSKGEDNLEKKFKELLDSIDDLPESPERQHLEEHVDELADAMGVELEDDDDDD